MGLEFDGVNGIIKNSTSDGDVTIKGNDGGSEISLLAFDVSAEGTAVFNSTVTVGSSLLINGTTPTLTIGDAGAEDTKIVFDGNAQDFYIALDDSADDLIIGRGSTVGTSADIQLNADGDIGIATAPNNVDSGRTLHIKGHNSDGANIRLQSTGDTADTDDMVIQKNDTVGFIKLFGGDTFKVFTSGAERLAIDADGVVSITTSGNGDNLSLISTDTDDDIGPNLKLFRAVTGADNDSLGTIDFAGQDDGSNNTDYASIATQIIDASNGSEDGKLTLKVMNAGTLNQMLTISGPETVVNEGSKDHDFRVESDNKTHALFVKGSDGAIGIGTGSIDSNAQVHIEGAEEYLVLKHSSQMGIKLYGDDTNIIYSYDKTSGSNTGGITFNHADGTMAFRTNGSNERMRILAGGGITFNGDTATANALDDYEEGEYTYTITGSTSGSLSARSGYAKGHYIKIGNMVTVNTRFETDADNSLSGNVYWSLPFTMANATDNVDAAIGPGYLRDNSMGTNARTGHYHLGEGTAYVYYLFSREGAANSTMEVANDGDTDGTMEGVVSITYQTT